MPGFPNTSTKSEILKTMRRATPLKHRVVFPFYRPGILTIRLPKFTMAPSVKE